MYQSGTGKDQITIHETKKMDLRGAIIIDGFPSVGLVSTIATNYLINVLKLEQIGVMDSPAFPALSIIRNGEPLSPVRLYGGKIKLKGKKEEFQNIVAFISEFAPPLGMVKNLSKLILDFAVEHDCHTILTPEGWAVDGTDIPTLAPGGQEEEESELEQSAKILHQVLNEDAVQENGEQKEEDHGQDHDLPNKKKEKKVPVYGIGSTGYAATLIKDLGIMPFLNGAISGVSGVLLNEGKRRNRDVVCLLAEAHQSYPDARAAASIVDVIDKMLFNIDIDSGPLFAEAEVIESQILMMHSQVQADSTTTKAPKFPKMMYS